MSESATVERSEAAQTETDFERILECWPELEKKMRNDLGRRDGIDGEAWCKVLDALSPKMQNHGWACMADVVEFVEGWKPRADQNGSSHSTKPEGIDEDLDNNSPINDHLKRVVDPLDETESAIILQCIKRFLSAVDEIESNDGGLIDAGTRQSIDMFRGNHKEDFVGQDRLSMMIVADWGDGFTSLHTVPVMGPKGTFEAGIKALDAFAKQFAAKVAVGQPDDVEPIENSNQIPDVSELMCDNGQEAIDQCRKNTLSLMDGLDHCTIALHVEDATNGMIGDSFSTISERVIVGPKGTIEQIVLALNKLADSRIGPFTKDRAEPTQLRANATKPGKPDPLPIVSKSAAEALEQARKAFDNDLAGRDRCIISVQVGDEIPSESMVAEWMVVGERGVIEAVAGVVNESLVQFDATRSTDAGMVGADHVPADEPVEVREAVEEVVEAA